jgi:hypothetical protein
MPSQSSCHRPGARLLLFLALLLAGLPAAAQVPQRWTAVDIDFPAVPGITAVDERAVWTIRGSGRDVWDASDQFHFCYRPFTGVGSISARILSQQGGEPTWAKTGLMFRENESPGARNFNFMMTSGVGGHATFRSEPRQGSGSLGGNLFPRTFPLHLRLQRAGNEFTGFYSEDGVLWRQATRTVSIFMPPVTLAGLSATSHEDGNTVVSQFDRVNAQEGVVSVYDVTALGGDRQVLLSWKALAGASGYHVYRVGVADGAFRYTRLTSNPILNVSYTDRGAGIQNGARALYAVTAVLPQVGSSPIEGPALAVAATPIDVPEMFGTDILPGIYPGAAARDAATDTITISGSGEDIFNAEDQCYFVGRNIAGDIQITAKVNELPRADNGEAKAGIMIRESLDPGARNVMFWVSPTNGARFQYRRDPGGGTLRGFEIKPTELKAPLWIQVTRRGAFVVASTSKDGVTFTDLGTMRFNPPMSGSVMAGLAITSRDRRALAQARFQGLRIGPAPVQ